MTDAVRIKETRAAIKTLAHELNKADDYSIALWDIIVALRGPDNQNEQVKRITTEKIRWNFLTAGGVSPYKFSETCGPNVSYGSLEESLSNMNKYTEEIHGLQHHFAMHVKKAIKGFEKLGLKEKAKAKCGIGAGHYDCKMVGTAYAVSAGTAGFIKAVAKMED